MVAREDSNLQPGGYERLTRPGKINENGQFRARLMPSVHVWLRRFIGHLLARNRACQFSFNGNRLRHRRRPIACFARTILVKVALVGTGTPCFAAVSTMKPFN